MEFGIKIWRDKKKGGKWRRGIGKSWMREEGRKGGKGREKIKQVEGGGEETGKGMISKLNVKGGRRKGKRRRSDRKS